MPAATPAAPVGVRTVTESLDQGAGLPLYRHPEWASSFDWLVQATTGEGGGTEPFDLGLFRDASAGEVMARWRMLGEALGMARAVHSHQVHEARVLEHHEGPPGLAVSHGYDGHSTSRTGVLLTVSVADCVPVFLADADRRRIAVLHGGWRGTAAGILDAGIERLGGDPADLHVHLGPAICGECYEVGPEVHGALGLPEPETNTPVDVRAVLAGQAVDAGVPPEQVTVSTHCTRCGDGFFSHRAGSSARQLGVLGLRPT